MSQVRLSVIAPSSRTGIPGGYTPAGSSLRPSTSTSECRIPSFISSHISTVGSSW